jgi:hypothetical protein
LVRSEVEVYCGSVVMGVVAKSDCDEFGNWRAMLMEEVACYGMYCGAEYD